MKDKNIKVVYNANSIDAVLAAYMLHRQYGNGAAYVPISLASSVSIGRGVHEGDTVIVIGLGLTVAELEALIEKKCDILIIDNSCERCRQYDTFLTEDQYIVSDDTVTSMVYDNFYSGHGDREELDSILSAVWAHTNWFQRDHTGGYGDVMGPDEVFQADALCYGLMHSINPFRLNSLEVNKLDPFRMTIAQILDITHRGEAWMEWANEHYRHAKGNALVRGMFYNNEVLKTECTIEIVNDSLNHADFIGRRMASEADFVMVYEVHHLKNVVCRVYGRKEGADCAHMLDDCNITSGHGSCSTAGFTTDLKSFTDWVDRWTKPITS